MSRFGRVAVGILACFLPESWASAQQTAPPSVIEEGEIFRSFYGVPLDLTIHALEDSKLKFSPGWSMGEGSYSPQAKIHVSGGIELVADFTDEGDLYMLETSSPNATGPRQISIGSSLADVRKAWPDGRLLWGSEHGRYITFDTGRRLYYQFSPEDLPAEAWSTLRKDYAVDPAIKVVAIRFPALDKE